MISVRRWILTAHPENSNPLAVAFAEEINRDPHRYWTRWGATRAKTYYAQLSLPVLLYVVEDQRP